MRNLLFAGAIAGALAGAVPASAAVFELSFSGSGISGTLNLTLSGSGSPYTVTGVDSGSTLDLGGTTYTITGLASYAGDDQKAYADSFVDFGGISVETSGGFAINLFGFEPGNYGVLVSSQNPGGDALDGRPYYAVTVTDAPIASSAPEPTTWAMMLLGFAGLGFVATRKRKTAIAAVS
jgi:hypothetical protein